jgi:hypothetical protein
MALLNTSLPNLIGGVSQQPDSVRFEGQCEEQTNAISSVVDGLSKRPNTRHLAKLVSSAISSDSFVHFVDRSETEKYVVIHDGTDLKAWNLDGTYCTINGASSFTTSGLSYIDTPFPKNDLKALTVGDTTFLLNKSKTVAESTNKTPALNKEAVITITQGDYKKNYTVTANVTPIASGVPVGFVAPTFTVNMERYVYTRDLYQHPDYGSRFITTYRWRVASVTVTNGGTNVTQTPTISVSSNLAVYSSPSFTVNRDASTNTVTSVTVNNAGAFEGDGYSSSGTLNGLPHVEYDYLTPTVTDTVTMGYQVTDATLGASTTSGTSAESANQNANSDTIATALHGQITGSWLNYFDKQAKETHTSNIYITLTNQGDDFQIKTQDSLSNTGMSAAYKEVNAITDLPVENKNGFSIKIRGATEVNEDDYYVKFETNNGLTFGNGTYAETVGFDISEGVKNDTMPHTLQLTAPNTFTIQTATYTTRKAGDDDTNPLPSFTNGQINNIFFFKNRLGFLAEDKIIMSEAGEPFNFFRTTVTSLLDSDPIDVQVSSQKVTNLQSATGFQENLILFSENSQFVLKGGDLLTPKTISVTPVTNFDASTTVNPIPLGAYMYFPFESSSFTGVREYTVNATTDVYDSTEISEHIPSYIPANISMFTGSSTEDALAMVSESEKDTIYVYRFFFNGQKKLLSSWFKFTLDGEIRGINFSKSDLNIVLVKNSETQLVKMPFDGGLRDTGVNHNTYLDMRKLCTVAAGATTIDLSYYYTPTDNSVKVYTTDGALVPSTNSGATVTLTNGALSSTQATNVWVGFPYTMKYTFSKQLFKQASGQTKTPSAGGSMMLKSCSIFYNDTAHFDVKVTPLHRDPYTNTFNPDIINTSNIELNLDDGFFRVPIFSNSEDTTISIENDSALPSNFQSAEFEVNAHQRSRRF